MLQPMQTSLEPQALFHCNRVQVHWTSRRKRVTVEARHPGRAGGSRRSCTCVRLADTGMLQDQCLHEQRLSLYPAPVGLGLGDAPAAEYGSTQGRTWLSRPGETPKITG